MGSVLTPVDDGQLTCVECGDASKCELCDVDNVDVCRKCVSDFLLHEDVCVQSCPGGYKENTDKTACIPITINDIGILPFPFLIAAFFGCLIAVFGKCKKKPGRTKFISTQNTITCFIVIVAFIQFLAVIALIIWAVLFGTMLLFIAGCTLLFLMVVLNIVFQIFYSYTFNRNVTPKDKRRKYKEGKISVAELKKFIVPADEMFMVYAKKHSCWSWTVAIFTFLCTFKCNKSYYSRFYSFDIFKARWT